uniref:Sushi domain-containing protein n=1 Tax=Magallana gigas TaxID=29159 RepID=A0A8W8JKN8_MAGGI
MKAHCLLILIVMQLSRIANCCSSDINIDNAFVSCSTNNVSCNVECYRGYIFPSGSTKESYSCQNEEWTHMFSSCKRIPSVSVTYSAIWVFDEVVTSACGNISSRLDNLREVQTNFIAVYNNFTNWKTLDICIYYNRQTFRNFHVTKSMFEGVTCGNLNTSNMIHKDLFVKETYVFCPSATELHNVSTSEDGMYIQYCDTDSIIRTTKSTTETTQMSTLESQTIQTEVSFTKNNFSFSQNTSLEKEASQGTTLITEVSSPDQNSRVNSSQITTITSLSAEKDFQVKSAIYILVPITGVFLISGIVTLVVCRRKRSQGRKKEKPYETIITGGQTQYINMADNTHHYDVIGYRREQGQESRS